MGYALYMEDEGKDEEEEFLQDLKIYLTGWRYSGHEFETK